MRGGRLRTGALALGLAGGLLAAGSAVSALLAVGRDPLYEPRLGFGIAALLLAGVTGLAALDVLAHPGRGALLMLGAGALGAVSINLYYINTLYVLALPLWLLGTLAALWSRAPRSPV
jgi:hypothetical protein